MSQSMRGGGPASDSRRMQRALDQLRAEVAVLRRLVDAKASDAEVAELSRRVADLATQISAAEQILAALTSRVELLEAAP